MTAAPPVPNNTVVETQADEDLVAGQEGVILVPFHSNPEPENMTWYLSDLSEPLYLNQTIGKYTSEGWTRYVGQNCEQCNVFIVFYAEHIIHQDKNHNSVCICC